ncbi:MAG: hypothetical protein ACC657_07530 [Thiohalomonadales bacterium]
MAKTLYKVNSIPDTNLKNTQIMTVCNVFNGEAILLENDNNYKINNNIIHASSVPSLIAGDKVIVLEISDTFVVTDKLRAPGDKPTIGFEVNEDGSLSLHSDVSIILKTLNAKIDILENGKIMIDGNEVYSLSSGLNRIQGTSIELN